ncbi:MAG TPA: hypothetical protein VFG07_06205 [Thermoplasmata archaeon]|nr:hypothetical protein [Thermoplasmata archaeon]
MGYDSTTAGAISLPAFTTVWKNLTLIPVNSNVKTIYQLNGATAQSYYSLNFWPSKISPVLNFTQNAAISPSSPAPWFTTSPTTTPKPPPDQQTGGNVLELFGTDQSTSSSPFSVGLVSLGSAPDPFNSSGVVAYPSLSAPVYLDFDVYVPSSSYLSHFAVDAALSTPGKDLLSQYPDRMGHRAVDMHGVPCFAGSLTYPRDTWVNEQCDVSEIQGVSILQFFLAYDNMGQYGNGNEPFLAYFDDIRLVNPAEPTSLSNGGFENPRQADGWWGGVGATILQSPTPTGIPSPADGLQDALIGFPPSTVCSVVACPTSNEISQVIRIPNVDLPIGSVSLWLSGYYNLGMACPTLSTCSTSTSFFEILLQDRLTLQQVNLQVTTPATGFATRGTWIHFAANITANEGHIAWLQFVVNLGTYTDEHNHQQTDNSWVYLDDLFINGSGVSVGSVSAGSPSTATVAFPALPYFHVCGSSSRYTNEYGFGSIASGSPVSASYWDPSTSSWVTTPIGEQNNVGIDLYSYYEDCTNQVASIDFTLHADANATGFVVPTNGGVCLPTAGCAWYNELTEMDTTVVEDYISGDQLTTTSLQPGLGSVASARNLSLVTPSIYSQAAMDQQQTAWETAEFLAIGILASIPLVVLTADLPLVFQITAGAILNLALGGLQLGASDPNINNYGSNCLSATPTYVGSVVQSLTMTCTYYGLGGSSPNDHDGSISMTYEAQVGKPGVGTGGHYEFQLITTSHYCNYEAGPPGSPSNPCQPGGTPITNELDLNVTT